MENEELYQPEIEQAALGSMLENDQVSGLAQVEVGLRPDMFYHPLHQYLCELIYQLSTEYEGYVASTILMDRVRKAGKETEFPDGKALPYLMALSDHAPVARYALGNLRVVKDDYYKREVVRVARQVANSAYETDESGESFLLKVPQYFYDLLQGKKDPGQTIEAAIERNLERWEMLDGGDGELMGFSVGIPRLDQMIGGAQPGLTLIAGRPSAGKTSLEGSIITTLCSQLEMGVGRVMLDMGIDMVVQRELARVGRVSLAKLNKGHAGKRNLTNVRDAGTEVKKWPMYDFHKTDIRELCSWARLMKSRHDIKMLTVDYIQLLTAEHLRGADENRTITYNAEHLKALSRELSIPVFALSQLSRESEKAKRPPRLSDLRGSGALEQAAAQVWFLYKNEEFAYGSRGLDETKVRPIHCDIQKNQNGGTGMIELWFYPPYFLLEDAGDDWEYPTMYEGYERRKMFPHETQAPLEL